MVGGSVGAAKAVATGGSFFSGSSFSLGLGIGLVVWGPILVGAAGAAAIYAYLRYREGQIEAEDGAVADQAADEGFMADRI